MHFTIQTKDVTINDIKVKNKPVIIAPANPKVVRGINKRIVVVMAVPAMPVTRVKSTRFKHLAAVHPAKTETATATNKATAETSNEAHKNLEL